MSSADGAVDEGVIASAFEVFESSGYAFTWTWLARRGAAQEEVDEDFSRGLAAWSFVVGDLSVVDFRRGVLAWLREGYPSDRQPVPGEVVKLSRTTDPANISITVDSAWRTVLSLACAIGPSRNYWAGGVLVDSSEEFERRLSKKFPKGVPGELRAALVSVGGRLGILKLPDERAGFFAFKAAFEGEEARSHGEHLASLGGSFPNELKQLKEFSK